MRFGQLFAQGLRFAQTATPKFHSFAQSAAHTLGDILGTGGRIGHQISQGGQKFLNFAESVPILGEAAGGMIGQARGILKAADRVANTASTLARAERALEYGNKKDAADLSRDALASMVGVSG
jgi:hypothetical protein